MEVLGVLIHRLTAHSFRMAASQIEFKNTWQPPVAKRIPDVNLDTEPENYDYNFMFQPKVLTGHRVQLRPFVVS